MTTVSFPTSFAELEAVELPGAVLDLEGRFLAMNAAGARLLGRPVAAILGRMVSEIAPGIEYLWDERVAAARAPGGRTFEIAIATAAGARMIEYIVAVYELEGEHCAVAFVTAQRPLGSEHDRDGSR
ncbi:MAG TPA: PAS domain-containing protein [Kofleriaceae bacterium]|nr:PAS domain-containing protein [Kofleriaceae bacterium]